MRKADRLKVFTCEQLSRKSYTKGRDNNFANVRNGQFSVRGSAREMLLQVLSNLLGLAQNGVLDGI